MDSLHNVHVKHNLLVPFLTSNNVLTTRNTLMHSFWVLLKHLSKSLTLKSATNCLIMELMVSFYHGSRITYLIDLNLLYLMDHLVDRSQLFQVFHKVLY